ncbi:MAG: hypothetical protein LQ339_002001 [Xanthoria mediterranea]|nr:MAG: hypothetical protein LQ339_002001 [Xanthoria mediterranea]
MFFPRHLISLTVLFFTLTSLVTSIPTPADTLRTSSSGVNTTIPINPLDPDQGINPFFHPDWAGDLQFSDCTKARYYFNGRVAFYNPKKTITFWSRKWTVRPEGDEFELPFGMRYITGLLMLNHHRRIETCTILVRMAKDFGNNVLPVGGKFSDESDDPPAAKFTWEDILGSIAVTLEHVEKVKFPDWTYGYSPGGQEAVMMVIPSSSVMSRRWAMDMRAGFGTGLVGLHGPGGMLE